ncbi:hypothetical protein MJA45_25680 [Paenibacillus aurantius]|uniref:Uncharacterized protein n=1 Tax=Paenibacillus aurantius TaxID=2918900 RepID=A0AA96LG94_9BACL|nr:hypothetical protein [Paenibacillus aurantius]WNQ10967.1 hypothetical protein MJA45_25680 [Paenibacillus aurantius]
MVNVLVELDAGFKAELTEAIDTMLSRGFPKEAIRVELETDGTLAVE